jgi:hypothetical protein
MRQSILKNTTDRGEEKLEKLLRNIVGRNLNYMN